MDSFDATLSIRKTKRQRTNARDTNESVTGNIVAIPNFRCDISEVLRCLGTHTGTAEKKESKRKQSKVYIVRSCKNLLHLKIFNVVSPLEETLARIHRVPINYSEHKFRLWQLPIRPLLPQSPLFPSPLLFFTLIPHPHRPTVLGFA